MALFGGSPTERQARELAKKEPEIIVACPGRLLDLIQRGDLVLQGVEVLTLDEADHMFDMGFLPDIRRILQHLPERRQNLFFSATMPREIHKLARRILFKPVTIEIEHSKPADTIDHALYSIQENRKFDALEALFSGSEFCSAIVFLRTKRRVRKLAQRLGKQGHSAVALQGNMSQNQRESALRDFRSGHFDVLVATDIAARGLDIEGVSHVVNYDIPNTPDAYTHRIGRTGRSGLAGTAFTFVTPVDDAILRSIEKRLGQRIKRADASFFGSAPGRADRSSQARRSTAALQPAPRNGKKHNKKNNEPFGVAIHRGSSRTSRLLGNEKPCQSRSRRPGNHYESKTTMGKRLYLGNLSFDTTDETLHAALSENGVVKDLHVVSDRDTGRPRGFAFAEMSTDAEAQAVIAALDGTELDGRQLTVNEARERQPRQGGGGRRY